MLTFTLDTNCIIDIAEDRPSAGFVRQFLSAHHKGLVNVALVASSASERQSNGEFLKNAATFNERRDALGFAGLQLLPSIGKYDVSFFDNCVYGSDEGVARERAIYGILFPSSSPEWADYAASRGAGSTDLTSTAFLRWRNQMLDAQALWAHDHARRNVFVSSDKRLMKLNSQQEFPLIKVMKPEAAAALLNG